MWDLIASFCNIGDNSPQFLSLLLSMCVCANYQNTPTPWQQHQAASFRDSLRRRRGKASLFLSQTCGVAAELSRGHTTHIAFTRIRRCTDWTPAPTPLHLSLTLHHLHVNFSPGCHLPTQSSILVCLPSWENQWDVLGTGVYTAAM